MIKDLQFLFPIGLLTLSHLGGLGVFTPPSVQATEQILTGADRFCAPLIWATPNKEAVVQNVASLYFDTHPYTAHSNGPLTADTQGLISLETLYLSDNKLKKIQKRLFSNLSHLENIYLENNKLETVFTWYFEDLAHPIEIDLQGNPLSQETIENLQNAGQSFKEVFTL